VAEIARDRSPSHDGGSVVGFLLMSGKSPETETEGGK
jgi:hypothetical protein